MASKSETNGADNRTSNPLKDNLASILAFLLLIAFAIFIVYLLGLTSAQETQWTRSVYLFSGAEAIAFAAAGFFFGSEIQRKRAERAEEKAGEAEQAASEAEKEAIKEVTKGRTLNEAIQSKLQERVDASKTHGSSEHYSGLGESEEKISLVDLREIANLANRLFP